MCQYRVRVVWDFGFRGGAGDGEVVFFEGEDYGDQFCDKERENEAQDYGLHELLPVTHGCTVKPVKPIINKNPKRLEMGHG